MDDYIKQFVDGRDKLKAVVAEHKSRNAHHLLALVDDFAIADRIFCITADNASSNMAMARAPDSSGQLPDFDADQNMLGCMAHIINLAAKVGIKALGARTDDNDSMLSDNPMEISHIPGARDSYMTEARMQSCEVDSLKFDDCLELTDGQNWAAVEVISALDVGDVVDVCVPTVEGDLESRVVRFEAFLITFDGDLSSAEKFTCYAFKLVLWRKSCCASFRSWRDLSEL
ncbi:hypothetical protein HDU87_008395 [Geranomyces variabilis]|uniref:Uncharacterized protein n=1 Tax=Geranomyces variabilis TaxID=109894 RepID=A0AAD5TEG6_9FUNG|nr:hypothetical protein HDU87_008395 [Geranomyces variabilis]